MKIYALRVDETREKEVFDSLQSGEARFGWSYTDTADLHQLRDRIEKQGWDSLTQKEQDCYQEFLLEIQPEDYVVYINIPEWGKCTLAKVAKGYYWNYNNDDFNHRFGVAPNSIRTFNRNDKRVHPSLSRRLKLQGRWWQIYAEREFRELVRGLEHHSSEEGMISQIDRWNILKDEIKPILQKISQKAHHVHPAKNLEELLKDVFDSIPSVKEVTHKKGMADKGADFILTMEQSHSITEEIKQTTCLVQIKSFEGLMDDDTPIRNIEKAFKEYPDAQEAVIISTADEIGPNFDKAKNELINNIKKPIYVLVGSDLALFILRNGKI